MGGGLRHACGATTAYSGQAVSEQGPANTTFDNTPPGGSPGVLFGFVGGNQARSFRKLGRAARRKAVLDNFVDLLRPRGGQPEELVRARLDPGGLDARLPGRAHAAQRPAPLRARAEQAVQARSTGPGTETADYWNGYMDGAVRSGERAAKEVLGALRR